MNTFALLCLVVIRFMAPTNAFMISWDCSVSPCDLDTQMGAINETIRLLSSKMASMMVVEHTVEKMKNNVYYQQGVIEGLSNKIKMLEKRLEAQDGERTKRRTSDRGKTSNDTEHSIDSQILAIRAENVKLWGDLSHEKLRTSLLHQEVEQLKNSSGDFCSRVTNCNSFEFVERSGHVDDLPFYSRLTANESQEVEKVNSTRYRRGGLWKELNAEISNRLDEMDRKLTNVSDDGDIRKDVSRSIGMNKFLKTKMDYIGECLMNLTEDVGRIAKNFTSSNVTGQLEQMTLDVDGIRQDLIDLDNRTFWQVSALPDKVMSLINNSVEMNIANETVNVRISNLETEYKRILNIIVRHFAREEVKEGRIEMSKLSDHDMEIATSTARTLINFTHPNQEYDHRSTEPGPKHVARSILIPHEEENEIIHGKEFSCRLKPPMDENVLVYFNGIEVEDFRQMVPSNQVVYFRCEKIGEYDLVGSTNMNCSNGHWRLEDENVIPMCTKLITINEAIGMVKSIEVKQFTCPEGERGHIPHPHDCAKYLDCSNGTAVVSACGMFFAFDPTLGACEWGTSVGCSSSNRPSDSVLEDPGNDIKPSIIIYPEPGSSGVMSSYNSKINVYPGTAFELHCIYPKKFGTPTWVRQLDRIDISNVNISSGTEYWRDGNDEDSVVEYVLRVQSAKETDCGMYTCRTPYKKMKSIYITVQAIDCPRMKIADENMFAIGHVSNKMSQILEFGCKNGWKLFGSKKTQCMATAEWSADFPNCLPVKHSEDDVYSDL